MPLGSEKITLMAAAGGGEGNYFGDGSLGTVQFSSGSITQTGDSVSIDSVLTTGSEAGGAGSSSYGTTEVAYVVGGQEHNASPFMPNPTACYEFTVTSGTNSFTSNSGTTDGSSINGDGDMVVAQFDTLTLDAAVTLTTEHPCRGLFVYVKNNCTINGDLSMTARGASADPTASGGSDSNAVGASGIQLGMLTSGGSTSFTNDGTGFNGCGDAIRTAVANQLDLSSDGDVFTISRTGAAGAASQSSVGMITGNAGTAGTTGAATISTGGGGGGSGAHSGSGTTTIGAAGDGTCFSGGVGSGAAAYQNGSATSGTASDTGGAGSNGEGAWVKCAGGTGNPGGAPNSIAGTYRGYDGSGGLIWLVVGGDLTIGAGGTVQALGIPGVGTNDTPSVASRTYQGSGSAASGAIMILYAGTLTNNGTIDVQKVWDNRHNGYYNPRYAGAGGKHTAQVS